MCALWLDYSDNWTIHGQTNLWTFNSWTSYGLCLSVSFCVLYAWLQLWGAGMVICLERGADLHMAQLMPLPLTVSCFSKIQIGLTLLVLAHLGSPGKGAVKRVCVCVCVYAWLQFTADLYQIWHVASIDPLDGH